MTARLLAETQLLDGIPALKLLEGLSELYPWILVTDSERRVLWMSRGLSELCGAEALEAGADSRLFVQKLPRPEQVFPLRSKLRNRSFLAEVPLELRVRDGSSLPVTVDVLKVETQEGDAPLLLAIARPAKDHPSRPAEPPVCTVKPDALFEALSEGVLLVDERGYVSQANPAAARLLGLSRSEIVNRPAALLFGGGAREIERVIRSLAGGGDAFTAELALRRPDGAEVTVEARARNLPPGAAGCHATLFVLRDVTERRRSSAQLERRNDELEHCVNALAHDLRSPLVALLGFSRLLRQDYGERLDDTGLHFLDRIEQAGRTMESLIHDLLELSRIGQAGERRTPVDPRAVLVQLKAELKPRLEESGIDLRLPDEPPVVLCDQTRLYQLFSNLIGNAIEHMGPCPEPRIEVMMEDREGFHYIGVRDRGRGIASEHHERIFDAFQSIATDGRRGTGIGLAIVKKIVETHGGRVWVESEPGAGCTFHVNLPR